MIKKKRRKIGFPFLAALFGDCSRFTAYEPMTVAMKEPSQVPAGVVTMR